MRVKNHWAMLAASAALAGAAPVHAQSSAAPQEGSLYPKPKAVLAAAQQAQGSLYPKPAEARNTGPLAKALGPARYILNDVGQSEEFRAQIRRAVGVHPVLHQEVSRRDEARGLIRAERSALYPRLSASLTSDYVIAREFGAGTDNVVESLRPGGQFNAGISASQLIFDGGAAFQRIKGAKAADREQQQSISARINELSLSALSAYYDVAAHQAIMKLASEFIARHESLLADVKERNRLGAGTKADVLQASARLAAARARASQIRESMRLAEIRYAEFFKAEPEILLRPSFDALAVGSRDEASALALQRHPEIGAAAARVDQAQAEYKAEKAGRLPELRATVNAVKFDVFEGTDDYDIRAGVNMNYDLYAGGARGAAIKRAGELARQQKFDEERVRQEIERDAAIAFERREASQERLQALADAVIAHHGARSLVAERFRVARGDLIDLLQAENDYFEAGVAYLIGLADSDMATYELMEHTGDLLRFFSPQPEYGESEIVND